VRIYTRVVKRHWIWDKTDRLFSRAERFAAESQFDEAVQSFNDAIRSDPEYPHLYVYRALALAELSRFDEALVSCDRAEQIDPSNFVFPMYRAAILLDSGKPQDALQSLRRALALQPGNTAVAGYEQLAKWDLGDETAIRQLKRNIREMPIDVQSRVAVRLEAKSLPEKQDGVEMTPMSSLPFRASLRKILLSLRTIRTKRLFRKVTGLIQAGHYEKALRILNVAGPPSDSARETWEEFYAKAVEGQCRELRDRLKELEKASKEKKRGAKNDSAHRDAQHRNLLLELGLSLCQSERKDEAYEVLEKWSNEYRAADFPVDERASARSALLELAEIDLTRETYAEAVRHCHEARLSGASLSDPRTNLIEARAELALGNRAASRRLFERYLSKDVFYLERRLYSI
jgi:tetratricopeptide (TPR) repeat protein